VTPGFLWLLPLPEWNGTDEPITPEMGIRRLSPAERAGIDSSDALLLHHDVDGAARDRFWLCHEFENGFAADDVRYRRRQDAVFKLMLHALYSVQILLPAGAPNLFLLYRRNGDGLTLESTERRHVLTGTAWARRSPVPRSFADDIGRVLACLHEAFQKPTLRLQIPVWLLEQGLSAPDRHIRILLWATGLDAITRSGRTVAFGEALCELLGGETPVFPPDAANRLPAYLVRDVAEDLYLLRNEMAHGLPFDQKFRKRRDFLPGDGELGDCRYDQVLEECAAFLLCRALRETFLS
jgi:hypothetical protein